MKIGCIIVSTLSFKAVDKLNICINSIAKAAAKENISVYFSISTNTKNKPEKIKHRLTQFLQTPSKSGFGSQNNQSINALLEIHPDLDYLLLTNDDAWVEVDFFQTIKNTSFHKKDVIIPIIYQGDNRKKINSYGIEIFQSGFATDSTKETRDTQWGTAACIIFNINFYKRLVKKFGFFFNPLLFFYYEDVELGIRSLVLKPNIIKSKTMKAHHFGSN